MQVAPALTLSSLDQYIFYVKRKLNLESNLVTYYQSNYIKVLVEMYVKSHRYLTEYTLIHEWKIFFSVLQCQWHKFILMWQVIFLRLLTLLFWWILELNTLAELKLRTGTIHLLGLYLDLKCWTYGQKASKKFKSPIYGQIMNDEFSLESVPM